MPTVRVLNLSTDAERIYEGIMPKEAVIAAFAQAERKDYNTWDYETRYTAQVLTGRFTYSLGDWCAFHTDPKTFSHMKGT